MVTALGTLRRGTSTVQLLFLTHGNAARPHQLDQARLPGSLPSDSRELKQDSPHNNNSTRYQNELVQVQNLTATSCCVAVGGVQPASNISEAILKIVEE
jgi:hypothetical protein